MFGFLRFLFFSILFYIAFKAVKKILLFTDPNTYRRPNSERDASKEVKDSKFTSDDVIDAKFKDVK
jgi:hypothetical protein